MILLIVRNKGNSLMTFPENYTVVDLEATGYSAQFDSIIEIGCIKFREGKEISRYESLIKPPSAIPYVVECITGIKNEMVSNFPTFSEIARELWEYLSGEIIVGHNINFDINFLYDNFKVALDMQFTNDYVDTLRLARLLLPEIKSQGHGLDRLCGYFGIEITERHRATADCLLTNELFHCLKNFAAENKIDLSKISAPKYPRFNLKEIHGNENTFDASHIFFGKNCVFTGKLEEFSRTEAAQIVANIGGYCGNTVTKTTNFLIVGDMDYRQGLNGYETSKLRKAKQLIEQKQDLKIIPESAFYDLVADYLAGE